MMNDSANRLSGGSKTVEGSTRPATYDDLNFREPQDVNSPEEDQERREEDKRDGGATGRDANDPGDIHSLGDEPNLPDEEEIVNEAEERIAAENAKLLEAFPETGDDEGRRSFFADAFETARELGFSDEEMREVIDHRLFKLVHYARLGLNAERARAKALQKVSAAPALAPRTKAKSLAQRQSRESREAMQRLSRTGSIRDAMAVDFE
ncbi:hypothetical protein [Sinorhizobium alkalisoli]|uniref:hypothetical protein n=1 Tax=Sinorhizobium alkalisoli TaxID=1752398 RepID=UPI00124C8B20|nr:hypothetical protein [Sinorhizobium alkalisoli]MCA1491845.1 hypothetical protein [Ensifer sp. NBAIM29]QFI66851.1 hypothetical protein EKH55_1977 [Sinorhizobium alkalisoli]